MKKVAILFVLLMAVVAANAQPYTIQQYLNIKSAIAPAFSPDGSRIAYLTNVSGTWQVWAMAMPAGKPRQLTNYDDNVSFVRWAGDGIIFGKAKGGDENTQFFWMKPDGSGVRALTDDPAVRHNFGDVSWDGKTIYYASNKRDRNFFDVYSMDLASGRETLLYHQDGNNDFVAANDSGTKVIISRDGTEFSLDNSLYLIDTASKAETLLTPHKDASQYFDASFVADGIVLAHNDGREFASLAEIRRKNAATDDWSAKNRETILLDDSNWDVGSIEMQAYGSVIAYTLNRDGFSELYLRKYETDGKPLITVIDKTSEAVKLPGQGIVGGMSFNHDQSKLAFAFGSARGASEIWIYDLAKKELRQMTWSDRAGIAPESFIEPHLVHYKTYDGREISAWFYEPPRQRSFSLDMSAPDKRALKMTKAAVPVIVSVHGGPEGQERPGSARSINIFFREATRSWHRTSAARRVMAKRSPISTMSRNEKIRSRTLPTPSHGSSPRRAPTPNASP